MKQNTTRGFRWLNSIMKLCAIALFVCSYASAQGATLKGHVIYGDDKSPVLGATVLVDGTTIGASTDIDGNFTIPNAPAEGTITISFIGYDSVTESIVDGKDYSVELSTGSQALEEIVVVGYGTMRKKEVTGSVARVDSEQIAKISTSDVGNALQGQIAGVNVMASSGEPGSVANVQIRGVSSVTGKNSPLYVVDGVPFDTDPGLSPSEIESIDVLKDAASAAIYGTRGAGGVILITTKQGKKGAVKLSLDAYYGVQSISSSLDIVGSEDYVYLKTLTDDGQSSYNYTYTVLNDKPLSYMNNTQIVDIIEKDNQPITNVSLSAMGGSDNITYSVIGNYFNQQGVVLNSAFERYNIRANSTFKKDKWTVNASLTAKMEDKDSGSSNLYQTIYKYSPIQPWFDPDMNLDVNGGDVEEDLKSLGNTLAGLKETTEQLSKNLTGNFMLSYELMDGLSLSTRVGTSFTATSIETIEPLFEIYQADGSPYYNPATRSSYKIEDQMRSSFTWETMLNYSKKWNKHDFKATAVFSTERYNFDKHYAKRYDLISNDIPSIGSATGEISVSSGPNTETTIIGMLGRAQYNYDDRYMASVSVRRDGSSRFAKENHWGYFPSASLGWNISEEQFWGSLRSTINNMKIRASYGTTGNQNFGDYTAIPIITPGSDYAFGTNNGDELYLGMTQAAFSNHDVQWETTQQINVGVDLSLLKSKLTLTADVYQSNKKDMLFKLSIPPSNGSGTNGTVTLNVGDMVNKGIEFAMGWKDRVGEFNYGANMTYARNINTITKMSGANKSVALGQIKGANNAYCTYLAEGYEAGAYFLFPTNGIIDTDEKLKAYQKLDSAAQMGDLIYVDTDGDGTIRDEDDRIYYGCGAPEAELGLNANVGWRNFDFSMNWYASLGNEIINGSKLTTYQYNKHSDLLYQWTPNNPLSTIPRQDSAGHNNMKGDSDLWIEDGSFIRLKNLVLGYSLPNNILSSIGVTKFRVYVAADNLWTITKYQGYDPEVGNDGLSSRGLDSANYPISTQIRGGIQLTF